MSIHQNKLVPGPNKDVDLTPGAHGGVATVTYYFDSKYKPAPKERATRAIVHEYDEKNRSVFRDYLTLEKGEVVPLRERSVRKPRNGPKNPPATQVTGDGPVSSEPRTAHPQSDPL